MKPISAVIVAVSALSIVSAGALTIGQIDTFEDGTDQNWKINLLGMGSPPAAAFPVNVPTGGPGGVDDNFLRLTSVGGGGAGSRLTTINFMGQWMGDYIATGIDAISMDVKNLGNTDLHLRLLFEDPAGGPPTNVAISEEAIFVPSGGDWQKIVFPIAPSDLTGLEGTIVGALANATALRIFHSLDPISPGAAIVAQLGVDNIQAIGVPDGGPTLLLLAGSSLALLNFRRRS